MQSMCERGQWYSNRMKRDLAIRALDMAVALRQPPKDCIHHTDLGSQYCSNEYQKRLSKHGFKVSMSGKGIATPLGIMLHITLPGSG
jgi:transposase InsO family protein